MSMITALKSRTFKKQSERRRARGLIDRIGAGLLTNIDDRLPYVINIKGFRKERYVEVASRMLAREGRWREAYQLVQDSVPRYTTYALNALLIAEAQSEGWDAALARAKSLYNRGYGLIDFGAAIAMGLTLRDENDRVADALLPSLFPGDGMYCPYRVALGLGLRGETYNINTVTDAYNASPDPDFRGLNRNSQYETRYYMKQCNDDYIAAYYLAGTVIGEQPDATEAYLTSPLFVISLSKSSDLAAQILARWPIEQRLPDRSGFTGAPYSENPKADESAMMSETLRSLSWDERARHLLRFAHEYRLDDAERYALFDTHFESLLPPPNFDWDSQKGRMLRSQYSFTLPFQLSKENLERLIAEGGEGLKKMANGMRANQRDRDKRPVNKPKKETAGAIWRRALQRDDGGIITAAQDIARACSAGDHYTILP